MFLTASVAIYHSNIGIQVIRVTIYNTGNTHLILVQAVVLVVVAFTLGDDGKRLGHMVERNVVAYVGNCLGGRTTSCATKFM